MVFNMVHAACGVELCVAFCQFNTLPAQRKQLLINEWHFTTSNSAQQIPFEITSKEFNQPADHLVGMSNHYD